MFLNNFLLLNENKKHKKHENIMQTFEFPKLKINRKSKNYKNLFFCFLLKGYLKDLRKGT